MNPDSEPRNDRPRSLHQCPACTPAWTERGYHCHECGQDFPKLSEFDTHRHPGGLPKHDRYDRYMTGLRRNLS